jgi:hypothetical protein
MHTPGLPEFFMDSLYKIYNVMSYAAALFLILSFPYHSVHSGPYSLWVNTSNCTGMSVFWQHILLPASDAVLQ